MTTGGVQERTLTPAESIHLIRVCLTITHETFYLRTIACRGIAAGRIPFSDSHTDSDSAERKSLGRLARRSDCSGLL